MALRVRDVMTSDLSTVTPDTPLTEVAREIIDERYSGVPVVDDEGTLVGVVEVEDILPQPSQVPFTRIPVMEFQGEWVEEDDLERYSRELQSSSVERVMRTNPLTVAPDARIGEVLVELVRGPARRIFVLDDGELVGVVTRTDLLASLTGGY